MHAGCVEPIFEAVLANDPPLITPGAAAQRMEEDLAAGATLADVDRNGVAVADRIQSQALRNELAAGHL